MRKGIRFPGHNHEPAKLSAYSPYSIGLFMPPHDTQETIADRIARGKEQKNCTNGAIVPFPLDTDWDNWFAIMPRSCDRTWLAEQHNKKGRITEYVYHSAEGDPIFFVLRADHATEKKGIRPLRCERMSGSFPKAVMKHIEGKRPLYNLDKLAARPAAPVLLVEGEKAADAGEARFASHVSTTWPGGALSAGKAEFLPLIGRDVTIWPDNDADGLKCMTRLATELLQLGVRSCRMVEVPRGLRPKWDIADADEPDCKLSAEELAALLADAPLVTFHQLSPASRSGFPRNAPHVATGDLVRDEEMLRFLIDKGSLDLGGRSDWIRVGLAIKASHGAAGFELWDRLSSEADGYDGNTDREWASFKERTNDENPLTLATFAMRAREAGWSPKRATRGASSNEAGAGSSAGDGKPRFGKGVDPAAAVMDLVEEAEDEFWLDQDDKPHVSYKAEAPGGEAVLRHVPVQSAAYKGVMARRYHNAMVTKVLQKDQANTAATLLEFRARDAGHRHTSSLRVGELDGQIYVDLGGLDGRTVRVSSEGWEVIIGAPVRFVRGSRGELPTPQLGGTLALFSKHFNLPPNDVLRAVAFMVGTFNLAGSYPILFIEGEQGTCKSTLADIILALIDPPRGVKSARFSFAPDEKDFHVNAQGARVLCFDNISTFSAAAADALCRMATGAASASRKLYTDDEEARLVVQRPVIATCIGLPSSRADLLSRALRVKTLPVEQRRTEAAVMRDFEVDRPMMLGFLMHCVSAALRNREAIEVAVEAGDIRLPRMGDFGQFIEAASAELGLARGEFSKLIGHEQAVMQAESAQTNPVGAALLRYFSKPDAKPIDSPARDVLTLLQAQLPGQDWWPSVNKLGNELTRIAVGLRELGIETETRAATGRANVMTFRIWTTPDFQPRSGPHEATSVPF